MFVCYLSLIKIKMNKIKEKQILPIFVKESCKSVLLK